MRASAPLPVLKDVVLVGAGHAHVEVLRRFGMRPEPGVRFTLVTREVETPYSGMLPGHVAGLYGADEIHIDTGPLCRFAGARLIQAEAVGLDVAGRLVLCRDRPPVPFDLLSLDIGSTPNTEAVRGAGAHAIPVKPIDGFLTRFKAMRRRVLARGGRAQVVVVGGGAGGVELVLAVERRLRRDIAEAGHDPAALSLALVTRSPTLLPAFPARMQARFAAILAERGVAVRAGAAVAEVGEGTLRLADGSGLACDEALWTTRAAPAGWLEDTGLALDQEGFVAVAGTLESLSHGGVFAAGDVAAVQGYSLPRSGVHAVRQGPVLADNLRRALTGRALRPYRPQRDALAILSTGERHALAARNGLVVEGHWVWRAKDWIDRRFMRRFADLPFMAPVSIPAPPAATDRAAREAVAAAAMRCGGCGAKVGAGVLARALGGIAPVERPDVVAGLDAPDDAALLDTGGPRLSVLTVDQFRAPVDDPYLLGRIAAVHALGDVHAMGGEPQAALAIATLPFGPEAKVEADLALMMAGAAEALRREGCALVGGHTAEGAELALGFAVTGLVAPGEALRKGGMQPGDALVLTKPIGTGTLLAADRQGRARARWVMGALAQMSVSNGPAVGVLRRHGVRAATDVTGFGLLGHLLEMARASGVGAVLRPDAVPLLEGARETLGQGIVSSLQPENRRLAGAVRNQEAARHPLFPALLDPQTAGGLLAAVPADQAEPCVLALRATGFSLAAIVGWVVPGDGSREPITIEAGDLG